MKVTTTTVKKTSTPQPMDSASNIKYQCKNELRPEGEYFSVVYIADIRTKTERKLLKEIVRNNKRGSGESSSIFIEINLKASTQPDRILRRITQLIESGHNYCFVPVRIAWKASYTREMRGISFKDLIMGDSEYPNANRQRLNSFRKTPLHELLVGKYADSEQLIKRFAEYTPSTGERSAQADSEALANYIVRAAFLALEKEERTFKGARYKIPRMVSSEVLESKEFLAELAEIQETTGADLKALKAESEDCLEEMSARHSGFAMDALASLGRFMYTRGFDERIGMDLDEIERIRSLMAERPVAIAFTHKSHIDGFLLLMLMHDHNLTPLHTFGGINMSFLGLGTLLRNSGAIFIRRSFKDSHVYKQVFRHYIDYLGQKRFPLSWALEGTRSRTGKLMPPRYGLISYVANAYIKDDNPELLIIPATIVYDQVPEVADYDALLQGKQKRVESSLWFAEYIKNLKRPLGRIHLRFGQGIELKNYRSTDSDAKKASARDIQKIAFDLAVDTNNATPITATSVICYALLDQGHRALTRSELDRDIQRLLRFIERFDFARTEEVHALDEDTLNRYLGQLDATGIIQIIDDGNEQVYRIPEGEGRKAAYYRNGLIHFFVNFAIGELAMLSVTSSGGDAYQEFCDKALYIRDMLKFEFFFEGSAEFLATLVGQMDSHIEGWREALNEGPKTVRATLRHRELLIGHGTLRPFIEAYLLLAKSLSQFPLEEKLSNDTLLKKCISLGKQYALQQRVHSEESVSSAYFENAILLAQSKGLMTDDADSQQARIDFLGEWRVLWRACRLLASISDTRRFQERIELDL